MVKDASKELQIVQIMTKHEFLTQRTESLVFLFLNIIKTLSLLYHNNTQKIAKTLYGSQGAITKYIVSSVNGTTVPTRYVGTRSAVSETIPPQGSIKAEIRCCCSSHPTP